MNNTSVQFRAKYCSDSNKPVHVQRNWLIFLMHSKNVICMIHHGINFDIAKKKGCQSVKTMNMNYFRRAFFFFGKTWKKMWLYIYIYSAKHERRCGYRYIYIYWCSWCSRNQMWQPSKQEIQFQDSNYTCSNDFIGCHLCNILYKVMY